MWLVISSIHIELLNLTSNDLELILSSQISQSGCNANRSNNAICENLFGNKAFLCTTGECRCSGSQSFPNSANTHCCK